MPESLIANSRMYDVTPEVRQAWRRLFMWLSAAADVPLETLEHPPPVPLEDLWARRDLGCVFMCGWPFSEARPQPTAIAAPVPSPERYGGRAVYMSDFVVRADSEFERLADTFGRRLAWTASHSHSGFNAPRHHLLRYRTSARPSLYAAALGPLITPRGAIQAVLEGKAEVAPVDSYVMDLLRRHEPATAAALRVVESTEEAPIPLLVGSAGTEPAVARRLTQALGRVEFDPAMRPILGVLMLQRLAPAEPEAYAVLAERSRAALAADYPRPG